MNIWSFVLLLFILPVSLSDSLALSQDYKQNEEASSEFRCGQILIHGSEQLTPAEMCRFLNEASDNPRDSQLRGSVQAKIIKEYQRRGFLEAAVSWKDAENLDTSRSSTTVVLTITEGPVYRLRRLEMIGNNATRDNVIRRRVVLNEDSAFDEELLELSIKRINELGVFEEFRKEDIEVKVNKKGKFIDLTFRLKEK